MSNHITRKAGDYVNLANVLSNFSNIIIPLIIFYIIATGIANKVNVYDEFLEGARDGGLNF